MKLNYFFIAGHLLSKTCGSSGGRWSRGRSSKVFWQQCLVEPVFFGTGSGECWTECTSPFPLERPIGQVGFLCAALTNSPFLAVWSHTGFFSSELYVYLKVRGSASWPRSGCRLARACSSTPWLLNSSFEKWHMLYPCYLYLPKQVTWLHMMSWGKFSHNMCLEGGAIEYCPAVFVTTSNSKGLKANYFVLFHVLTHLNGWTHAFTSAQAVTWSHTDQAIGCLYLDLWRLPQLLQAQRPSFFLFQGETRPQKGTILGLGGSLDAGWPYVSKHIVAEETFLKRELTRDASM